MSQRNRDRAQLVRYFSSRALVWGLLCALQRRAWVEVAVAPGRMRVIGGEDLGYVGMEADTEVLATWPPLEQ